MSFWDDLQKTLSDAAAFTVQKTTELTGITKLKYNIHVEEGKLERTFAELGRLYYETQKSGEDNADEIATLIMQADKISADLDSLKADVAKYKSTCVCAECKAEVSNECTFCPVCGSRIEASSDEEEK